MGKKSSRCEKGTLDARKESQMLKKSSRCEKGTPDARK
jgi:hypothetical protein